jgi:predicted nuclease with TOPRIM domain
VATINELYEEIKYLNEIINDKDELIGELRAENSSLKEALDNVRIPKGREDSPNPNDSTP